MSPDSTQIVALRIEPTYSAREAAVLLGRSYSWLDQRLRQGEFVRADGTTVQPLRSPGGYRYFSVEMRPSGEGRRLRCTVLLPQNSG